MDGIKCIHDGNEKRKHVTLTILKKVEIIRMLDSNLSVNFLAKKFGIGPSTVYDIKKNREKILKYYGSRDCNAVIATRKTIRNPKSENLDDVLYEWYKQKRSEDVYVTGPHLCKKARELQNELNIEEPCNFSSGWLTRFKQRHGIRYKACGKKLSANNITAEGFNEEFPLQIKEENLSPAEVSSDSEDEEQKEVTFKQGLAVGYEYLDFIQKQNFVTQQEISTVRRLQEKILRKSKILKPLTVRFMHEKYKNKHKNI